MAFPISRDPPEGGTSHIWTGSPSHTSFQFLGIPPKGELNNLNYLSADSLVGFQFLGIPPKGELGAFPKSAEPMIEKFPISRDPPEGGTFFDSLKDPVYLAKVFPISRDPPEGGTRWGTYTYSTI